MTESTKIGSTPPIDPVEGSSELIRRLERVIAHEVSSVESAVSTVEVAEQRLAAIRQETEARNRQVAEMHGALQAAVAGHRLPLARRSVVSLWGGEGDPVEALTRICARAHQEIQKAQGKFLFRGAELDYIASAALAAREIAEQVDNQGAETIRNAECELEDARRQAGESEARRNQALSGLRKQVDDYVGYLPAHLSDWDSERWNSWVCAERIERGLRVGTFLPTASWLPTHLKLPVSVRFPAERSLAIIHSHSGTRGKAIGAMQSALVRLLASMPAGSFELSFVDPVGLGQSVAPFLHLAEFDESLISGRVSTQKSDIEQRLGEAVVHVETVVQQYLRSAYVTIDAYNADAGEIAERYRFLVICDFPAGMDEPSISKVASLLEHGPRSGLYVVLVASGEDASALPAGLLDRAAVVVDTQGSGRGLSDLPVPKGMIFDADSPPALEIAPQGEPQGLFAQILTSFGVASQTAGADLVTLDRVFELRRRGVGLAFSEAERAGRATDPAADSTWWKEPSTDRIRVPVGRAGARDLCEISFDSKALATALVVGAPGAGKTTLLHSVILGLAMIYSPEELELYLLDSKQGVEFKVYERLPHAKAVAIRNEREFGVSVLQGLRDELDRRAALIKARTGGGQVDLAGFREETGEAMPRILMVADEFHELFERVDALGQKAADLLDDLVRQGRSYGIHVLLGSQTLDGVEALPRHTLQLIQGRVAFACREQDAIVAMREDNREVRSLSEPGDGVWNARRGDPEANVRFQGLLIPADERVALAAAVRAHADASGFNRIPVVFDGDEAFPLDSFRPAEFAPAGSTFQVRLGEPCAVADSVRADFPRRPGANLLAVAGDSAARSILHSALAAVRGSDLADVGIVDLLGDPDDVVDHYAADERSRLVRRAGAGDLLSGFAETVAERISLDDYRAPTRVVVINGLKGLRDPDGPLLADGRSFSDLFEAIVRDGPEVGVHAIVLADSLATVDRRLGLHVLKDLGLIVAGAMSRDDSDRLIDSEAAGDLRDNQAVFHDDAENLTVKIRTYDPATAAWVAGAGG